jgi:hypothetical protein
MKREMDSKTRAFSWRALNTDGSMVRLGDPLCNRKPQTAPALSARTRFIDPVEPVENLVEAFRRNSKTGILDGYGHSVLTPFVPDPDPPPGVGIADRVRDQCAKQLPETNRISGDHPLVIPVQCDRNSPVRREDECVFVDAIHQFVQPDRFLVEGHLSGLHFREGQEIVHYT